MAAATKADRKAQARRLFEEGLAHADARRWAPAADCFERAADLQPTPEIAYNLSAALVQLGDLVRAADLLRQVESDQQASAQVRQAAHGQLQDVRPRLAFLRIELPAGAHRADRAKLLIDGRPVAPFVWGSSIPMNPAVHHIELRGPDAVVASRQIRLREGEHRIVDMAPEVPLAARASSHEPARQGLSLADGASVGIEPNMIESAGGKPGAETRGRSANHTWAWVALGAVVVGVTTAALIASRPDAQPSGNVGTWTLGAQ